MVSIVLSILKQAQRAVSIVLPKLSARPSLFVVSELPEPVTRETHMPRIHQSFGERLQLSEHSLL